jgi:hypothetical protein
MRILLTNNTLAGREGSELYVRDLAIALKRRGHEPIAFSALLGDVSGDLREAAIPVANDLRSIRLRPDVIHGQHHLETMAALARFPGVPAIFVSHGWLPWQEAPPRHPRIRRYVAVDDLVRERLVLEGGIEPADVSVLRNFVDLRRFPPRDPLPARPRRALVFNARATEDNFGTLARAACEREGIELNIHGYASGQVVSDPGTLLRGYDLVFARARSALEAMAGGCAVIVADPHGMAGMVTSGIVETWRKRNFGFSTLTTPLSAEAIGRQLALYDAADAAKVSEIIRRDAGIEPVVDAYESIYAQVAADPCAIDDAAERDAMVVYLQWLSAQPKIPGLSEWSDLKKQHDAAMLSVDALRARLARADAERSEAPRLEGENAGRDSGERESGEASGAPRDGAGRMRGVLARLLK